MSLTKLDFIGKSFRASLLFGISVFIFNPATENLYGQSVNAQNPVGFIEQGESAGVKVFALRLKPGQDLRKEIENFAKRKDIKAGFIVTTVGSLEKTALRLANQNESTFFDGKFEIVSLVGTISPDGVHLHLSVSDNTGRTIGGHLVEGCRIYTTAEIIIGEAEGLLFTRETDKLTGYKELRIRSKKRHPKKN
jgi:predicted DNA-binding protein with PD1-like motif